MLVLRFASENDIKKVFDLSNDDEVRKNSIHKNKIEWSSHTKWFAEKLKSTASVFYVAEEKTQFIGYIRLDEEDGFWIVTIHLNSEARGKGFGKRILQKAVMLNTDKNLIALVKEPNILSQRIFKKSGFVLDGAKEIETEKYLIFKKQRLSKNPSVIAVENNLYDNTDLFEKQNYVFITSKEDFSVENLKLLNPKYVFLPHWSYIVPQDIYENFNCVIFHMTDVPFGRGGSPLQNLILRGICSTKISAIKCNSVLDGGDVYLKKDFDISSGKASEIYERAGFVISEMIDEILRTEPRPIPQIGDVVEFKRRKPEESNLQNINSLSGIYDYIRMLDADGYPNAFLENGFAKFLFHDAEYNAGRLTAKVKIEECLSCARKTVLIVAAHPDDEVLGCFGTVAKMIKMGYEAYTLILSGGKTSRGEVAQSVLDALKVEMLEANKLIGIKEVFHSEFPDNAFDSVQFLSIVKEIEYIKQKVRPQIIFTHHVGDMNIDHQITHKAVLTATRPMRDECVKEIYSMEIPSSTEWNSFSQNTIFVPNVFEDISETVELKTKAMSCYKSELRKYPHPRSLQFIKELAKTNGVKVGLEYSENFMLVRKTIGGGVTSPFCSLFLSKNYRSCSCRRFA